MRCQWMSSSGHYGISYSFMVCKLTDVDDDFNTPGSASANMMKAIACIQNPVTIKKICKYQQSRVAQIEITESVNL